MFFRNLYPFRFSEVVAKSLGELEQDLDNRRLRTVGPLEQATLGFVSPLGRNGETLTHIVGQFKLFACGGEYRILPGRVVNEALATRLQEISEREDRRIGGKERRRIKDDLLAEMLPRAFVDHRRSFGYVDLKNGWLVLDTSSRRVADEMVSELRQAIGTFPVAPMAPEESPRVLMTDWAANGKLPAGLALGDAIELRDPAESGATVKCSRQDLETDEVREHLKTGKQVYKLALTFDDRISFVLGEDLVVRKLRFLDQVLDDLMPSEGVIAELDSRFTLMTLEVERLLTKLDEWFGLPRPTDR